MKIAPKVAQETRGQWPCSASGQAVEAMEAMEAVDGLGGQV